MAFVIWRRVILYCRFWRLILYNAVFHDYAAVCFCVCSFEPVEANIHAAILKVVCSGAMVLNSVCHPYVMSLLPNEISDRLA